MITLIIIIYCEDGVESRDEAMKDGDTVDDDIFNDALFVFCILHWWYIHLMVLCLWVADDNDALFVSLCRNNWVQFTSEHWAAGGRE